MTCQTVTLALGAYTLGALEADEDAEVEAHLTECPECRAELDAIAALPALLGQLSVDDLEAAPPRPSEELFARLRDRAADEDATVRRGLRGRRLLSVAAALLVVLAGAGTGIGIWASSGTHNRPYVATAGPIKMRVQLHAQAEGTGIDVNVAGLPEDEHCRLVAIGEDGSSDLAGSWTATYAGNAQVTGSTSIDRGRLSRLVLFGTNGQQLVSVPV